MGKEGKGKGGLVQFMFEEVAVNPKKGLKQEMLINSRVKLRMLSNYYYLSN